MIAVDTNILVHAHRADSPWHHAAGHRIAGLAEGGAPWAIPWPCVHEFMAVVTHPKIWVPPTPLRLAMEQVQAWLESPSLHLLGETRDHWTKLKALLTAGSVTGPTVHDARIAAICLQHGVKTLWSQDRDFSRMKDLHVVNPLI